MQSLPDVSFHGCRVCSVHCKMTIRYCVPELTRRVRPQIGLQLDMRAPMITITTEVLA